MGESKPRSAAASLESHLHHLHPLVSEVARWCRSAAVPALPEGLVPGANQRERVQLAALGSVAKALSGGDPQIHEETIPESVKEWLTVSVEPPRKIVEALREKLESPIDPLALVYERIVAGPRRRQLGTFFTPEPVLKYMREVLTSVLRKKPASIADPGAGVGAFTIDAIKSWPEAAVYALDVNVVTLGLLATRPDLKRTLNAGKSEASAQFIQQDFLTWLQGKWGQLPGPKLILGNPPYVRHQQLTADTKQHAQTLCSSLTPGLRSGLSTYFLAASLQSLEQEDALCLLLPANWLEADYARTIRKHLWNASRRRVELHIFENDTDIFPGAQTSAMIIFVGPEQTKKSAFAVHRVEGSIASGFKSKNRLLLDRSRSIPAAFTLNAFLHSNRNRHSTEGGVPLGTITRIRRGVATGANGFFLRTLEEKNTLRSDHTVRAISRLRDLHSDTLDHATHDLLGKNGARCWLLSIDDATGDADAERLISQGESSGVHLAYLCRKRSPWYQLEKIAVPDILIGPMGKSKFRIVVNDCGAIPTNTLYGLRLSPLYSALKREGLARWLASDIGQDLLRMHARQHGDGLLKLEPGSLSKVLVPSHIVDGQGR